MVILWILSGQHSRRCLDPKPLPFNDGKRVKRRVVMTLHSREVRDLLESTQHQLRNSNVPYVYGAVDASPAFIYNHAVPLGSLDREQYWQWRSLGIPGEEQWFFRFRACANLPEPVPAAEYITKRFTRVFAALRNETVEELCSMMPGLPDWLNADMGAELHFAVLIPEPFAVFCMNQLLEYVVVPAIRTHGCWWRAQKWLVSMMNPEILHVFEASRRPNPVGLAAFSLNSCHHLANNLRSMMQSGVLDQEALFRWLWQLQERDDALHVLGHPDKLAVFAQVVDMVMLADKLRDAGNLAEVIQRVLRVVFPPDLNEMVASFTARVKKLHKSQISRAHLTLDVAFMLHKRVENLQCPSKVRYLMWDSSPQFGRDYQMSLVQEIRKEDLPLVLRGFRTLMDAGGAAAGAGALQAAELLENEEAFANMKASMDMLHEKVTVHALPAVLIGFGAASFSHKLWALLHSIRLETFTEREMCDWARSVLTVASDYGVERLLASLASVNAQDVAGWFQDTSAEDMRLLSGGPEPEAEARHVGPNRQQGDEPAFEEADEQAAVQVPPLHVGAILEDEAFEEPQPPLEVKFERMLGIPGLHHIIDNATKGLADVMQRYKDYVFLAQQVCKLLRRRDTRPKLLQRCFSQGMGLVFAEDIKKFEGWINTGRWGTVAFSVPELLKVKQALQWGWDEEVFLRGAGEESRRATGELAQQVSSAVNNPVWWAWLGMLEIVCTLIRRHIAYAESCPCHWHILEAARRGEFDIPIKVRELIDRCPMRGRRAAEISTGEFLAIMRDLWAVSAAMVYRVMGREINDQDRRLVMQEFDRARTHLAFYFALKLTHMQELPWKVFQVSHSSEAVAQLAAHEILQSDNEHPLLAELRGPLRESCESWIEGEPVMTVDKQDLQAYIAALRFVPTSERPIEGQHAKVHRHGLGKPCHTEHFQSYFLRSEEMARALDSRFMSIQHFAWFCQAARNHKQACVAVGLDGHPALQGNNHIRQRQDPMRSKVIYHADPFTLYAAEGPPLNMQPPPNDPGGDRQPRPALENAEPADPADDEGVGGRRVLLTVLFLVSFVSLVSDRIRSPASASVFQVHMTVSQRQLGMWQLGWWLVFACTVDSMTLY